eukprot:TRINITY_DN39399_c0_g1_i1.p1 TRINITY_DN39399_c0_g1~~TRINITY_DN39399_c0_g1_i1.p1  ORF type:complete len:436 (+),score=130.18 TRINITY_DN39399_c0_g1_i1:71-1309(+)
MAAQQSVFDGMSLFPHLEASVAEGLSRGSGLRQAMLWLLTAKEAEPFADCVVAAEDGTQLHCHRCIIDARAPGLAGQSVGDCCAGRLPMHRIRGVQTAGALGNLMFWIYTGRIGVRRLGEDLATELLGVAEAAGLRGLVAECREQLDPSAGGGVDGRSALTAHARDIKQLYGDSGDVVFTWADGYHTRIHRPLLVARSKFHRGLFADHWAPPSRDASGDWCIDAGGVSKEGFADALRFVCSANELSFVDEGDFDRVYRLVEIADMFDITDLGVAVSSWLRRHIGVTTVCGLWNACSEMPSGVQSADACRQFFCENFGDSADTEGFLQLKKPLLLSALQSGRIDSATTTVFRAVQAWGKHQAVQRGDVPRDASDAEMHSAVRDLIQDMLPPNTLFSRENTDSLIGRQKQGPWF